MSEPEAAAQDPSFDSLLGDFLDESGQLLDRLNENLLQLDDRVRHTEQRPPQPCNDDLLNEMFRSAHNLKGLSAMLGFSGINHLTHHVESVFDAARKHQLPIDGDVVELMFQAVDRLVSLVDALKEPDAESVECEPLIERIGQTLRSAGVERAPSHWEDDRRAVQAELERAATPPPRKQEAEQPPVDHFQDLEDEPETESKYLSIFVDETETSLDSLTDELLAREGQGSPETAQNLLIISHRIKGAAAAVGRHRAAKLAHLMEDVLQKLVDAGRPLTPETVDALLSCTDALRRYVQTLKDGHPESSRFSRSAHQLLAASSSAGGTPAADRPVPRASQPAAPVEPPPAAASNKPTATVRVDIERLDRLMNLAGQLVINKARFSQIADRLKGAPASRQSSRVLDNVVAALEQIHGGQQDHGPETDLRAELENLRSQARSIQNDLEIVRRDVQVLTRVRASLNELFETIHQLDRVSNGIQQGVMDTRMVPIGPLFARFKRVIRDVTRGNGKEIRLEINGEKTELDKRMIDELGDPLIHLVRNAADHGIELPEVRELLDKPPRGTVILNAFHRGNSIVIQVIDDGKGLDAKRIGRKAVKKGLLSEADCRKMTARQIHQLIWEPGLSTASQVTEVSGRGMGMDIVKSRIEELNGTVDLESQPGRGTTLTIKLPLTLAILPSLLAEIDGDVFAVPLESVHEIVQARGRDLTTIHGKPTARVRGRAVSTVRLEEIFGWTRGAEQADRQDDPQTTLVIIGEGDREIGLAVDRVLGQEDAVIQSIGQNYRHVAGIAGASILGDGRIALILDLAAVIDMAAGRLAAAGVS